MTSQRWVRAQCRVYWLLMRYVYPHDHWLYKRSADYREWWGPR